MEISFQLFFIPVELHLPNTVHTQEQTGNKNYNTETHFHTILIVN